MEHRRAIHDVICGKNICVFGAAGTGKTTLIHRMKNFLPHRGLVITASTGIAAAAISGTTLHSWAGVGLGLGSSKDIYQHMKYAAKLRWRRARILIIDEISMISAELFDKLDFIGRKTRGRPADAFGGLQLICVGDVLQLPPLSSKFIFEADAWAACEFKIHHLTKVFRQTETDFLEALGELRLGKCGEKTLQFLKPCMGRELKVKDEIEPTLISCRRHEVEMANLAKLAALPGEMKIYKANDSGETTKLATTLWPEELRLKVGAQVLYLVNNSPMSLVNGSRGVVVKMEEGSVDVIFEDGKKRKLNRERLDIQQEKDIIATRWQIPLCLAWSLTVHKLQGMTLEQAYVDVTHAFEYAQVYVALSRVRSSEGLSIIGFRPERVIAHSKAIAFLAKQTEEMQQNIIK